MKKFYILLAYLYFPFWYFIVYLLFIVPNLHLWKEIPFFFYIICGVFFIIICSIIGATNNYKINLINSIGISFFNIIILIFISFFGFKGFTKSFEGLPLDIEDFKYIFFKMLIMIFIIFLITFFSRYIITTIKKILNK